MTHSMTWADFYLICFAVGFCFSFFSFLFGGSRTVRLHLPHFHGHVGGAHLPAMHGPVAAGDAPLPWGGPPFASRRHRQRPPRGPPRNLRPPLAFLPLLRGTRYLLWPCSC